MMTLEHVQNAELAQASSKELLVPLRPQHNLPAQATRFIGREDELPPDTNAAAQERGKARDLWTTVQELSAELGREQSFSDHRPWHLYQPLSDSQRIVIAIPIKDALLTQRLTHPAHKVAREQGCPSGQSLPPTKQQSARAS